jgi:RsiW-degrading membrane proteinase PrsW (M82 family)
MIALGLSGLVLLGLATARVGTTAVLVGAAGALLPVGPVVGTFLWMDRWEPQPSRLLLLAFFWGSCVATITAMMINDTTRMLTETVLGGSDSGAISAVVFAPLVEEGTKGAFLVGLVSWRRREFDGIVHGVVYAGMTAAGFAFTENIYYFGRAFAEGGGLGNSSRGVIAVFMLRGVLAPFAHPLFTAMMGIGLGIAARTERRHLRVVAPLLGYLGAASLHALWNGSAVLGGGTAFLNVYFLIMVPIFVGVMIIVLWQRRREQRVVAQALPAMATMGWIGPSEVGLLASLAGRHGWRLAVRRRTGRRAVRVVVGYQTAVTELAFLRDAMKRGTAGGDPQDRHQELLLNLRVARAAAVGALGAVRACSARHRAGRSSRSRWLSP